jgi:hypothetical protein
VQERITIHVESARSPLVRWPCRRCGDQRAFASTGAFRTNASGKTIDVWLIYGCVDCGATRNLPVVERTPVRRVAPALLAAAEANDSSFARRCARDRELLRRASARLADEEQWRLTAPPPPMLLCPGSVELRLELPEPLLVRPVGPLAECLGVSRGGVGALVRAGRLAGDGVPSLKRLGLWDGGVFVLLPDRAAATSSDRVRS